MALQLRFEVADSEGKNLRQGDAGPQCRTSPLPLWFAVLLPGEEPLGQRVSRWKEEACDQARVVDRARRRLGTRGVIEGDDLSAQMCIRDRS